jgi:hypothetical protein
MSIRKCSSNDQLKLTNDLNLECIGIMPRGLRLGVRMYLELGELSGTAKWPFEVEIDALDILFCFCAFANCLDERRSGLEGRSESDPDVVISAEWVTRPALEGER